MKNLLATFFAMLVVLAGAGNKLLADEDKHEHELGEKHEKEDGESDHAHNQGEGHAHGDDEHGKEEHDDKGEHDHEDEENSAVGPDKGILEKGKNGFKLSPEAIANFGISTAKVQSPLQLPPAAIIKVKDERFVYRLSAGWIKKLHLDDVNAGDELIITGTGFVRIAEIVAVEGMAEGHSH